MLSPPPEHRERWRRNDLDSISGSWYGFGTRFAFPFGLISTMRLIIAVIQPTKLNAVHQALARIGVHHMSVTDAMGYARQGGHKEIYRGHEYKTNLLRKIALEIAVNDDFVEKTIQCLEESARTSGEGNIGDGKIFVLPMEEAVQISDGLRGKGAM
jgi:nitrogen regulatory protein P-II 1